ncbi:MAG: Trk system potassium transporter TrkA [Proteobacteria bacterium]|nr:Trk system potassium transporter TrkA [Pseudomonadota bacterium]
MNHKKNIIVIGAGEIGTNVAYRMVKQGHDVTVIERNSEKMESLTNMLDVKTVLGNGCLPKNLELSGANKADVLIALANSDEVNMVASQVAYSLFDVKTRMARVYHQAYLDPDYRNLFNDEDLPVDYVISPEKLVADRITQSLEIPQSYDFMKFAGDEVTLIGLKLTENFQKVGCTVEELEKDLSFDTKVMFVSRGYKNYIPQKREKLHKSDIVYFLLNIKDIDHLIAGLGEVKFNAKDILIIGGGNTGFFAAQELEKTHNVKIIEKDLAVSSRLAEKLEKTTVIHADAMNFNSLDDTNVAEMDVVLNLTDSDEANSLCTMYEQQKGARVIYTLIKNSMLGSLTNNMRFSRLITPRDITVSQVNKFIRNAHIYDLFTIQNNSAEVVEVRVSVTSKIEGMSVDEFNGLQIGQIGAVVTNRGTTFDHSAIIRKGDRVIAVVPTESINKFYDMVEE